MKQITLKPGRDASVKRKHPWVFEGSIKHADKDISMGETVSIVSAHGQRLAAGAFSPRSQIRARIWSFNEHEEITPEFFLTRLQQALSVRRSLIDEKTTAYRLVNAESDGLPGLIVDRYGNHLVCQFLFAGVERWKQEIVGLLRTIVPVAGIYERSEGDAREKEGLGICNGSLHGRPPPDVLEIKENGLPFFVDIKRGHKTGLYLDQRDNRVQVAAFSRNKAVLNCFSYTGGFSVWALHGGAARVVNVDSSPDALSLGLDNVKRNGFDSTRVENMAGDVFQTLRTYRDSRRMFDLVILDPPKFAAGAQQVPQASRGYKDINLLALKLIRPGGYLFTFSCSGHIKPDLFQKVVSDAALDAGRDVHILKFLSQAPDHPVSLSFPEGRYVKGLLCRVV